MFLTDELEKMIHLIAQAFARTHGAEDATPFADTVLEHAKAIAADMAPVAAVAVEVPATPPAEQNVIAQ
jgi:hypothetical protein